MPFYIYRKVIHIFLVSPYKLALQWNWPHFFKHKNFAVTLIDNFPLQSYQVVYFYFSLFISIDKAPKSAYDYWGSLHFLPWLNCISNLPVFTFVLLIMPFIKIYTHMKTSHTEEFNPSPRGLQKPKDEVEECTNWLMVPLAVLAITNHHEIQKIEEVIIVKDKVPCHGNITSRLISRWGNTWAVILSANTSCTMSILGSGSHPKFKDVL